MIKLKVSFNSNEFMSLSKKEQSLVVEATSGEVKQALADATPVDTGLARDSWEVTSTTTNEFTINNSQDYIGALNAGHSQQAPAHFIEAVALRYGTPKGTIVEYED